MAQTVYETDLPLVEQGLTWIDTLVNIGALTNAIVLASTSVATLKSNIDAVAGVFETSQRFREECTRAGGSIDRSFYIGALTDANVNSATTVDALRALFTTQDANIVNGQQAHSTVA